MRCHKLISFALLASLGALLHKDYELVELIYGK